MSRMTTARFMKLRKMHDEPYHAIGCEILDEVAMAWRDRDAIRAELDLVRGAIRADDERLYAAWVRIHGAPDDCANIGCDAPEWMADEILRLRAELDRTKEELERVRRNHLRRMAHVAWLRRDYPRSTPISFRRRGQYDRFALACSRAALERKADA